MLLFRFIYHDPAAARLSLQNLLPRYFYTTVD